MNSFLIQSKTLFAVVALISAFLVLGAATADAASFSSASATLSTSRPSASSPLSANAASGATQISILDNGSRYLASDSAKLYRTSNGLDIDASVIVASQSAALTTVYLADTTGAAAEAGTDVLMVPITAVHTLRFTLTTALPAGGNILITYPGAADNTASPSATGFAFNGLDNVGGMPANVVTNGITCNANSFVTSPQIMCESTSGVAAGTVVSIIIGCSAQSSGSCTTPDPRMINPTKTGTAGTAESWKVVIQSRDSGNVVLDNSTVAMGTIESVTVRATVDPTLTFTIAGIANGSAVNTGNTTGCLQTETTNTGIPSTSTEVGLGVLGQPPGTDTKLPNIAAQLLTVSTNAASGYSLVATSSGQLINPATGFFINSATTAQAFPDTTNFFGLHACGLDTDTTYWNSTPDTACNSYVTGSTDPICRYGWPTQTTGILLASDSLGPVGNAIITGNGLTSVSYAATVDASVPPGEYTTVVTYVATPSF